MVSSGRHVLTRWDRIKGNKNRYYLGVTKAMYAKLFNVSIYTITRWINKGLLDPRNWDDVCNKLNNRHLLDKRNKPLKETMC